MPELRARLWQRELVDRLIKAGEDEPDLWDWIRELDAEEEAVQSEFQNVGVVFAQLSQVEVGVRRLWRRIEGASGEEPRSEKPRFADCIGLVRRAYAPRFVGELKALEDVRHLRNHLAHGEVRVGIASLGPGAPLEPVITLVHTELGLPDGIHDVDPLRGVVEGDLDVYRAMEIASAGLEALLRIMIETGFSPYDGGSEQ